MKRLLIAIIACYGAYGVDMDTVIHIIRHGESLANAARVYIGQMDWDLSARGYEQAEAAARYLSDLHVDAIYSSDLKRAYNTALAHARVHGLEVTPCRELREICLGEWEGHKVEWLAEQYPKDFAVDWRTRFGVCKVPGGESVREAGERFYRKVLEIAKRHVGGTVIIASHAAVIRSFYGIVLGVSPEELCDRVPFPTNASTTTVGFDGERLVPLRYGFDEYFDTPTHVDA